MSLREKRSLNDRRNTIKRIRMNVPPICKNGTLAIKNIDEITIRSIPDLTEKRLVNRRKNTIDSIADA